MNLNEFTTGLKEFLELDSIDELKNETIIRELEEFDSFFVLSTIAYVDETFSMKLTAKEFENIITINDLIEFIGTDKFTE